MFIHNTELLFVFLLPSAHFSVTSMAVFNSYLPECRRCLTLEFIWNVNKTNAVFKLVFLHIYFQIEIDAIFRTDSIMTILMFYNYNLVYAWWIGNGTWCAERGKGGEYFFLTIVENYRHLYTEWDKNFNKLPPLQTFPQYLIINNPCLVNS